MIIQKLERVFLYQVDVFLAFSAFDGTHIDSKSKIAIC